MAQAVAVLQPAVVVGPGTERGNEVLAQAAARLDAPMVANCTAVGSGDGGYEVTRQRWGGSLLEEARVLGAVVLMTIAAHAMDATATTPGRGEIRTFEPTLDPQVARSIVRDRVDRAAGLTLATAPVVVGGGRGVGSADGFAPLEELAALLGGVVGCSRVVTNNGWRSHTDQVGQTGTRIAPTVYLACGISGAIQHWVGAMAAKHIIAVNTDTDANMVTKADYAVIGDLHEIVPAISAEIRRRRGDTPRDLGGLSLKKPSGWRRSRIRDSGHPDRRSRLSPRRSWAERQAAMKPKASPRRLSRARPTSRRAASDVMPSCSPISR